MEETEKKENERKKRGREEERKTSLFPTLFYMTWSDKNAEPNIFRKLNPFKHNGFFHSYYLEKSILHFRGVRLFFSSLA